MYELKTEGIVLGKYNLLNDNDEIVVVFTEKNGKVFIRTKGTKKILSKLKPVLEIFSLNNYYLIKKNEQSKYFRLIQASPIKIYTNIRNSLNDIFLCFLFLQLINKFLEPEDPNVELYEMTKTIFDLIDKKAINLKLAEIFFKIKLLKFTGFNIKDNTNFLKNARASSSVKKVIFDLEKIKSLDNFSMQIENLQMIDEIINDYIKSIINEDLTCLKLIK